MGGDAGRLIRGAGDTIVAPATARGRAARAVLRMSGPRAFEIVAAALEDPRAAPPELGDRRRAVARARLGLNDARDAFAVDVLLLLFPGPRSYTGEDQVEIHLPGSPSLMRAMLERLGRLGARAADPGEFTRRAFLEGRIDLTQAEAVAALIHASGESERRSALDVLGGAIAERSGSIAAGIETALAAFELDLDFSDQDLGWTLPSDLGETLAGLRDRLAAFAAAHGARTGAGQAPLAVLVGPTNAGKSSLFNALVGRPAAIVAATAGTTRDVLRAEVDLGRSSLRLADTAGEGHVGGEADRAADRLRAAELARADVVIEVRDGRLPPPDGDPIDRLLVLTRADLVPAGGRTEGPWTWVSSRDGSVLELLRARLRERLHASAREDLGLAFNERQRACFSAAAAAVERARRALEEDAGSELCAADLHEALQALRELTGEDYPDRVLDAVFRDFCIGK